MSTHGANNAVGSSIEGRIRGDADVRDAVLVGSVAYVVIRRQAAEATVRDRLNKDASVRSAVARLVFLPRLPLDQEGRVDLENLASRAVVDDDLLDQLAREVESWPGVRRAAGVHGASRPGSIALSLLDSQDSGRSSVPSESVPNELPPESAEPQMEEAEDMPSQGRPAAMVEVAGLVEGSKAPKDLFGALEASVQRQPNSEIVFHFVDGSTKRITLSELRDRAERLAASLQARAGESVTAAILMSPSNFDLVVGFWGCIRAGLTPLIVPVPVIFDDSNRQAMQLRRAVELLPGAFLLTDEPTQGLLEPHAQSFGLDQDRVLVVSQLDQSGNVRGAGDVDPDAVAFYVLTSGSTGKPKLIGLTHWNALSRGRGANQKVGFASTDRILNWLPFDHIGTISDWHIRCVDLGCEMIYADKELVIGEPARWLSLLSKYEATHSWAPNFAFSAAIDGMSQVGASDRDSWSLASVRHLLTAGETVSSATMDRFIDALAPYGLREDVFLPAFGMAEMGSGTTYSVPAPGGRAAVKKVSEDGLRLGVGREVRSDENAVELTSLGGPIPGIGIRICDTEGNVVEEGVVGRFQVKGSAVFSGYYQDEEATQAAFTADGWFDTGDKGFIHDGELYLTGRSKETIVINGANYYPAEIESIVEALPGVSTSFCAAFSVPADAGEREQLVVLFHTTLPEPVQRGLVAEIRREVVRAIGLAPDCVLPVEPEEIEKTAIGKLQRTAMAKKYRAGGYDAAVRRAESLGIGGGSRIPDAFFESRWVPRIEEPSGTAPLDVAGTWLVVESDPASEDGNVFERGLQERGASVVRFVAGASANASSTGLAHLLGAASVNDLRGITVLLPPEPKPSNNGDSLASSGNTRALAMLGSLNHLFQTLSAEFPLDGSLPVNLVRVHPHEPGNRSGSTFGLGLWSEAVDVWRSTFPWFEGRLIETEQVHDGKAIWGALDRELARWTDGTGDAVRVDGAGVWRLVSERIDLLAEREDSQPDSPKDLLVLAGNDRVTLEVCLWARRRYGCRIRLLVDAADRHRGQDLVVSISEQLPSAPTGGGETDDAVSLIEVRGDDAAVGTNGEIATALAEFDGAVLVGTFEDGAENHGLTDWEETVDRGARWTRAVRAVCDRLVANPKGHFLAIARRPVSGPIGLDTILSGLSLESAARLKRAGVGNVSVCLANMDSSNGASRSLGSGTGWKDLALSPADLVEVAGAGFHRGFGELRVGGCVPDREPDQVTVYYCADDLVPESFWEGRVLRDEFGTSIPCEFVQLSDPRRQGGAAGMEWWPSVADYFVYDELIYHALTHDERRNDSYKVAIRQLVKDKIVVDVGTGKEAILARFCVESGAAKVYAIEIGDEAYQAASELLESLGLTDRVHLVKGDARNLELPELCDVCISEIVGPIGGCEGASLILNDCRRFLKPDGVMLPCRSETRIAAVTCPDELLDNLGFHEVPGSYVKKIYDDIGHPMDLRMCIKQFPHSHFISDSAIYEDLDFSDLTEPDKKHPIRLEVTRSGRLDGFLVWLNLHTIEGEVIDIIEYEYSWLPVYFPVFWPGEAVSKGDWIEAECERRVSSNGVNPDYFLRGVLHRADGASVPFEFEALHHDGGFKVSPFYQRLFGDDAFGRLPLDPNELYGRYLETMVFDSAGHPDTAALKALAEQAQGQGRQTRGRAPQGAIEQKIAEIWCDLLSVEAVGIEDSFFELGGHSLLLVQAEQRLNQHFERQVTLVDLFKYSTVETLAEYLDESSAQAPGLARGAERADRRRKPLSEVGDVKSTDIAVIGMACRFPGADNPDEFWQNLKGGVESVSFFSDEEILASGVDPKSANDPRYVKGNPIIEGIEWFDAGFFDVSEREAKLMDPQQRLYLECSWEALEDAGYDSSRYEGSIGVFGGASMSTYLLNNVFANRDRLDANDDLDVATLDSMGGFQLMVANDKDYLTTRVSYKMDLRGPSVNIQTACSTSLVAIHQAVQSILSGECDMAMAGGVAVKSPQKVGHLFQEGMIVSSDGHCRAFDERADGTVFGSGAGVVVLKSLEAALKDGDNVYAVIKGSAVNNDGGAKVGYMAPNGDGQSAAVIEALGVAGVSPTSLGLVEAHGTGTPVGDPIEVSALSQVFRRETDDVGICALGSVKTNVGHLQIASGIVGFMKAALAVRHGIVPPTLHFNHPNPAIGLEQSPFFVNTTAQDWPDRGGEPRRASVNSLGIGGANAHVILEQAPEPKDSAANRPTRSRHVLTVSARGPEALLGNVERLDAWLSGRGEVALPDLCFTYNLGRKQFGHRAVVTASTIPELLSEIKELRRRLLVGEAVAKGPNEAAERVCFVFTGQGAQYPGMGKELYGTYSVFREAFDRCVRALEPELGQRLESMLGWNESRGEEVNRTENAQPYLFAFEYALAQLWLSWGIQPAALVGHSVGEYVAACLAGVFSVEEGMRLIVVRGKLMGQLPEGGGMAAIFASVEDVRRRLGEGEPEVQIAAINSPEHTVISGPLEAVRRATARFEDIGSKELRVSHAFHSELLAPALAEFEKHLKQVQWNEPKVPIYTNLSGELATEALATPEYWLRHAGQPVQFSAGVLAAFEAGVHTFVEVGPRGVLAPFVARILAGRNAQVLLSHKSGRAEPDQMVDSAAALFRLGLDVDWAAFDADFQRRRVSAPTYAFQRKRYWLDIRPGRGSSREEQSHRRVESPVPLPADGILGTRLTLPLVSDVVFETELDAGRFEFLNDHQIFNHPVVPGAVYVSMALEAARRLGRGASDAVRLEAVSFQRALVLPQAGEGSAKVHLSVGSVQDDGRRFRLARLGDDPNAFTLHAEGQIGMALDSEERGEQRRAGFEAHRNGCPVAITPEKFYTTQTARSIDLGPSYRWLQEIWRGEGRAVCRIEAPAGASAQVKDSIHPGLLDACFGLLVASVDMDVEESLVPFRIERVDWSGPCNGDRYWAEAILSDETDSEQGRLVGSITLFDSENLEVVRLTDLEGRRASQAEIMGQIVPAPKLPLWEQQWSPLEIPGSVPATEAEVLGSWLVVSLGGMATGAGVVGTVLRSRGAQVGEWVIAEDTSGVNGVGIAPDGMGSMEQALGELTDRGSLRGVVVVSADGSETGLTLGAGYSQLRGLLNLVKALSTATLDAEFSFSLITPNAFGGGERSLPNEPFASALWGFLRSVEVEYPNWVVRYLDAALRDDKQGSADLEPTQQGRVVSDWLLRSPSATAWRYDSSRLEQLHVRARTESHEVVNPGLATLSASRGGVLIVGGTGALGLQLAEWLVARIEGPIYLLSRRGETPEVSRALANFVDGASKIRVVQADAADAQSLSATVAEIEQQDGPIRGVIHASGVLRDGIVSEQRWEDFSAVLDAKIAVAMNLDSVFDRRNLEFFVLFSSAAGVLGNPGQTSYSAANAFLDGLAAQRRGRGLAATSVAWGPWNAAGMAREQATQQLFDAVGIKAIDAPAGLRALESLLESQPSHVVVMDVDWDQYLATYPNRKAMLPSAPARLEPNAEEGRLVKAEYLDRVRQQASEGDFSPGVAEVVAEAAQSVLGMGDQISLSLDSPLMDQGLDSLMAVELRNRLATGFGLTLPVGVVFSCPTIEALTEYLVAQIQDTEGVKAPTSATEEPVTKNGADGGDFSYLDELSASEIENLLDEELQ